MESELHGSDDALSMRKASLEAALADLYATPGAESEGETVVQARIAELEAEIAALEAEMEVASEPMPAQPRSGKRRWLWLAGLVGMFVGFGGFVSLVVDGFRYDYLVLASGLLLVGAVVLQVLEGRK